MLDKGVICKQTKDTVIRLAPPLVITNDQIDKVVQTFKESFEELKI